MELSSLSVKKRVNLIPKGTTPTHYSSSFFAITTIRKLPNNRIQTFLTICVPYKSRALHHSVQRHLPVELHIPWLVILLCRRPLWTFTSGFLCQLGEKSLCLSLKRHRISHFLHVVHIELVLEIHLVYESGRRNPEKTSVKPYDCPLVHRTSFT